ncbi:hypothetical protein QBC35DRAFT_442051 [Podospora australis]|uniref:Myb-like domain-containing protein n=1 Tax=Podospora australis TaxID=1536484 RepID=A0AAN6WLM1_9PEZI|nr:hypothetical protein QBC35DRAFT_442051 [Podospora australis]
MQFPATGGHHSLWQPLGSMPGVPSCQPDTISPKLLQLRSTPTPSSSSESMRTSYLSPGDGVGDYHTHNPNTDALRTVQTIASSKPRTMLPDHPRVLLSNPDTIASSSDEKTSRHDNGVVRSAATKKLIKPKGKSRRSRQSASLRLASSRINAAGRVKYAESEHDRKVKDDFLIQGRAKGLTFKQIKVEGGYLEAESTLRGRFRTLTKPVEKRLRNPRWYPVDVRLLDEGVRNLSPDPYNILLKKVPWAKVAEYINNNGGTYLFGTATCKARWNQLVAESLAKGFDPTRSFHEQQQEDDERKGVMQQSAEVEEAAAIGSSDDPFYSDGEHHI